VIGDEFVGDLRVSRARGDGGRMTGCRWRRVHAGVVERV
jgi:hypothetical protein